MKKIMKRNIILSALLVIMLCVSLISGATYALFTSSSEVNIAVTSGKVKMTATVEDLTTYSMGAITSENGIFTTGGTAVLEDGTLTLNRIVPGDKVTFTINIQNLSNVLVKYRTVITTVENDGLFEGLNITIGEQTFNGRSAVSAWQNLAVEAAINPVQVVIELPESAGNQYQEKTCKIAYTVEAVQGNAETADLTANEINIYSATDLIILMDEAQTVNSAFLGRTLKLMNDIDFNGATIKGFGSQSSNFAGTFDGQGHTIKNFNINKTEEYYAGLFNQVSHGGTIKNLTVENATVVGNKMVGVIASNAEGIAVIDNCHVKNSTIIAKVKKAGVVVGYTAGSSTDSPTVTNCTATNCTVLCADVDPLESGEIVGYVNIGSTVNNNTATNVTVTRGVLLVSTQAELKTALDNPDGTQPVRNIVLQNDIDMTGWTALNGGSSHPGFTIEGNGYKLNNQTAPLFSEFPAKDFTVKNVKFVNANINTTGGNFAGVLVGQMHSEAGGTYLIENCEISNSQIKAYKYAGGFIGHNATPQNGATGSLTIKNCKVKDTEIATEDSSCGGLIGHTYMNTIINNCSIEGTTSISCAENRSAEGTVQAAKAGALVGTINAGTTTITACTVATTVTLGNVNSLDPVANGLVGRLAASGIYDLR